MARNRMIKPEYWTSKTISKLSFLARLLFIGLWNFSDDYGVLLYNTRKILGDVFPNDLDVNEKKVAELLQEIISFKLLTPVTHKETDYLIVSSWKEHQTVPNPNKRRWLEEEIQSSLHPNESLISVSLVPNAPKGKGKSKGKVFDFETLWNKYPNKLGKTASEKHFKATVKTDEDYESINKALDKYINHIKSNNVEAKFIKHGSTWFNNWKDWIEYKPNGVKTDDIDRSERKKKITIQKLLQG